MGSRIGLAALLAGASAACSGITETRAPTAENPTTWTYAKPLARVAECLQSKELVADRWGGKVETSYSQPDDLRQTQRVFEIVLDTPGYAGSPPVYSEVYLFESCPLVLYGSWRFVAEAIDREHTKVSVVPELTEVHNYRCFYIGHPWGCAIGVDSTTIEEYRLLTSLGQCLGEPALPPVVVPQSPVAVPQQCDHRRYGRD